MAMAATLTEGDKRILILAWQSFKTSPQVDFEKLRQLAGYKTAASANACYIEARKRLLSGKMTARDQELIPLAWKSFKNAPQVDYKVLQARGNYKSPASATAVYLAARKKLLGTSKTVDSSTAAASPAKTLKRKAGKKAAAENESITKRAKLSEDDTGETTIKDEDVDSDDEGTAADTVDDQLFKSADEFLKETSEQGEDDES